MNKNNDNEKIEKMCCGCEYASQILDTDYYICKKLGVVLYNYCCKKFALDVLKRKPMRIQSLYREQFSQNDFSI